MVPAEMFCGALHPLPVFSEVVNPPDRGGVLPKPDHVGMSACVQRYLGISIFGGAGERFSGADHPLPVLAE